MDPSLSGQGLTCQAKWTVWPGRPTCQAVLAFGNPDPAFCKICKLVWRALLPRMVNHILQFKANKILFGEYKVLYTFTFRFILVYGVTKSLQSIRYYTCNYIYMCAMWANYIHQWFQVGSPPPPPPPISASAGHIYVHVQI